MDIKNFFILMLACNLIYGVSAKTISVFNNCPYQVMPGVITNNGTADTTGFSLDPQGSFNVTLSSPWSGSFWARTGCTNDSSGKVVCNTGDCGTGEVSCNNKGWIAPATVVDFSAGADMDIYDVSLLDGFNVPVSIHPVGGNNCSKIDCTSNINLDCPNDLHVKDSSGSTTIGCKSACNAFNQPQYCCTGDEDSVDACQPSNYSQFFNSHCPGAYSYPYDDDSLTSVCMGSLEYGIVFCP